MKKETSKDRTAKQEAQLEAMAALPDEEIDTDDIPKSKIGTVPSVVYFTVR